MQSHHATSIIICVLGLSIPLEDSWSRLKLLQIPESHFSIYG